MALFSFYNMRKPRQYDHKPIYWDPHKEALEERISKVKREMGVENRWRNISRISRELLLKAPHI